MGEELLKWIAVQPARESSFESGGIRRFHSLGFVLAILAIALVQIPVFAQTGALELFTAVPPAAQSAPALSPHDSSGVIPDPVKALRTREAGLSKMAADTLARLADIRATALAAEHPALTLNLFPDTSLSLSVEWVRPTPDGIGFTVAGSIGVARDGEALLTFYRDALSGSVRMRNGEFYEIFVRPGGQGEIRQVRFDGFPKGMQDSVYADGVDGQEGSIRVGAVPGESFRDIQPRFADSASSTGLFGGTRRSAGGETTIDVIVAYTQRAADARGGTAGMLSHINQVMAESNAAFSNSAASIEFRLVHAVQVDYDDSSASMSYSIALNSLRSTTIGGMDEVHALRDQYGADLVTLWVSPPLPTSGTFTVGQAFILTSNPQNFAPFAFSVVHQNYAGGSSLSFPHEAGHNMGLAHDVDNGGASGGLHLDSRGYQQKTLNPKFFTIMAYSSGCGGCRGISHFSNPSVAYQSVPTGILNDADAVRTLNEVAPFAAAWRGTSVPSCTYSVNPLNIAAPSGAGSFAVQVTSQTGCPWTTTSSASWISVSTGASGSGSGTVNISVAANPTSAGRSAALTVAGKAVTVAQAAAAPVAPTLTVSPSTVQFEGVAGQSLALQSTINIATGSVSVPVSITGSIPPWLSISTTSFNSPAPITLSANAATLAAGTYQASLSANAPASANGTVSILVQFTVSQEKPLLVSSPALSFKLERGSAAAAQRLLVRTGGTPSSTIVATSSGASWLFAVAGTNGNSSEITVQANPAALSNGVYDGSVALGCSDGQCAQKSIPVRLEVVDPRSSPGLAWVSSGGVVNAGSFAQGTTIGSWMSAFGSNLSTSTRGWRATDFVGNRLPLSLDGVSVSIDGQTAFVQFVSPGQVNFQAPANLGTGWRQLVLTTPNGSDRTWVYVSLRSPGFFQFDPNGNLAALHANGQPVSPNQGAGTVQGSPARSGEAVEIYGTGFGPTSPEIVPGFIFTGAARLVAESSTVVTIGGLPASVDFVGLTGAGLNQLNVVIPPLPPGTYEVLAVVEGSPTQFIGKIAVQ